MQLFYNLSDLAMEDALYEIDSIRRFASLIFNMENDQSMELAVLSPEEMQETKGTLFPVLGFGATMAGYLTARSLGMYYVTRVGTISGTVGLAEHLGGR